jgi:hypothetical protein
MMVNTIEVFMSACPFLLVIGTAMISEFLMVFRLVCANWRDHCDPPSRTPATGPGFLVFLLISSLTWNHHNRSPAPYSAAKHSQRIDQYYYLS